MLAGMMSKGAVLAKAVGVLNDKLHSRFPDSTQQFERRITLANPSTIRISRRKVKHVSLLQEEAGNRETVRAFLGQCRQNLMEPRQAKLPAWPVAAAVVLNEEGLMDSGPIEQVGWSASGLGSERCVV